MTKIIHKYGKKQEIRETKKPLIYLGKELEWIDYSETTAHHNFCEIKFKGENKTYIEEVGRLMEVSK